MTNREINTIKEFRRFATTYIYNNTSHLLINSISEAFCTCDVSFEPVPQQLIQFTDNTNMGKINKSEYTEKIHTILKQIFINYFNNEEVISIIKNKLFVYVQDTEMKKILLDALLEIQCGNPQYLGLLFNITILDQVIYLYL